MLFFEQVAARWDDMRSSFYNADVIDALAEHGRVTEVSRVADVGTGTGFVAAGLAGQAATVTGIDNSPAMLAVAAGNLAALEVGNVQLAEGELDNLPLPDDSVDVAVANMVLHHGGTIAITDEVEHHYEWMRTEQADIWLGFTPVIAPWPAGLAVPGRSAWRPGPGHRASVGNRDRAGYR